MGLNSIIYTLCLSHQALKYFCYLYFFYVYSYSNIIFKEHLMPSFNLTNCLLSSSLITCNEVINLFVVLVMCIRKLFVFEVSFYLLTQFFLSFLIKISNENIIKSINNIIITERKLMFRPLFFQWEKKGIML